MAGNKTLLVTQFCADPQASDGGLQLKHWLKTLENHFAEPETEPTAVAKLATLHSKVDDKVYNSIAQCATYDLPIAELKRLYIKEKSPVYARHLLLTRRQQPNEPMDHYAQELRQLLLDSTREPRTHEQAQDDLLLDAYVAGVSSQDLRLKLLEKTDLPSRRHSSKERYTLKRGCSRTPMIARASWREPRYTHGLRVLPPRERNCSRNSRMLRRRIRS
uniref:uncharacterized protein isoform X2 n=1 Tax=Myxine glutinosa TaxID=7769 RepID=UPI003590175D